MVDRVHSGLTASIPGGDEAGGAGHTPGPWFPRFNGHFWEIGIGPVEHSPSVASVYLNPHANVTDAVRRANARLIAAAPELLASCREAAKTFRRYEAMHADRDSVAGAQNAAANASYAKSLESAIAKAVGERPAEPIHRRDGDAESVGVGQ